MIATNTDSIVEGAEEFSIDFAFQEISGSFVIAPGGSNIAVTIIDDDCKLGKCLCFCMYITFVPCFSNAYYNNIVP